MSTYNLIKQLENPPKDDKTPLPKGLNYTEMKVIVEGEELIAHIPTKEVDHFNSLINECKQKISRNAFNNIMREVRGIRG